MRVFLAPLFFLKRFCKHCVRIYYSQYPDVWVWQHELGPLPPLGFYRPGGGFAPDYPLLAMFDEFVISEEAFDRITHSSAEWLGQWPKVLKALLAEGSLSTIDLDEEIRKASHHRGQLLRSDLRDSARWSHAMAYHDSLMATAHEAFGNSPREAKAPTWQFDTDHLPGVPGSDGELHALSAAPLVDPGEDPNDPHFQLHELALDTLTGQLREVNAALAVSKQLNVAPMLWAPYQEYLTQKSQVSADVTSALADAKNAQLFFSVAFPRYSPESATHLAKLRADRRVVALRAAIRQAAASGTLLDPQYPQKVLEEVLRLETRIGRVRRIAGWLSSAVGLLPLPGLGATATVVSEAITSVIDRSARRRFQWFYLMSDGEGHT